jgi:hypothetical protein
VCPEAEQIIKLIFCIVVLQQMPSLKHKRTQRKQKVGEGINFILRHFPQDKIFPRRISTKDSSPEQFIIYNKKEMLKAYEQADFIDCKVSAYAAYTAEEYIYDNGINMQTPDFIFIDINNRSLSSPSSLPQTLNSDRLADQVKVIDAILQNMKEMLYGANPTILWAGNCFHIYQPVEAITLERIEEFIDLKYIAEFRKFFTKQHLLSALFSEFSKQKILLYKHNDYHHNHNSCSNALKDLSIKSPHHMLMIPGTLHSKFSASNKDEEDEIQIAQTWDGNRPKLDLLLAGFQIYLTKRVICRKGKQVDAEMPHHYYYSS